MVSSKVRRKPPPHQFCREYCNIVGLSSVVREVLARIEESVRGEAYRSFRQSCHAVVFPPDVRSVRTDSPVMTSFANAAARHAVVIHPNRCAGNVHAVNQRFCVTAALMPLCARDLEHGITI